MVGWTTCGAALLLLCFRIDACAAQAPPTTATPSYRIDLRLMVKGPFVFEPIGHPESRVGLPIRSLWFLDNRRVAATVVTQAAGQPMLPRRGEPTAASPFRLDAVLIEAATGKILGRPAWPSNSRFALIVAANDRGFVMQAGTEVTLLASDLGPIKRLALPPLPADEYGHDRNWSPRSSWSGRRVVLLSWRTWDRGSWLWLDAEDLQVLESWQDVGTGDVAVSDDRLVMDTGGRHFGDPPSRLVTSVPGGKWSPIPSTVGASSWQFVGPDLLYFHRYSTIGFPAQGGVFLMHTDSGGVSRLGPPRKGWGLGRAAASRTGKRFVILIVETKGSHPALDIGGHGVLRALRVFDPPFTTPTCTLEVRGSRIRNPDIPALSPDGRHLAVFSYPDPVLEVYELPPPN